MADQQQLEVRAPQPRQARQVWSGTLRFMRNKPLGAAGAFLCLALIAIAVFAPVIARISPKDFIGDPFMLPTGIFSWGTDELGRDVFSRIIWGARLSLYIGFSATFLGTTVALSWGLTNGYWAGSWYDTISQRLVEALQTIPTLVLAMVMVSVLGPSVNNVVLAIAISFVSGGNRIVRSQVLGIRQKDFILAARALGATNTRILIVHILPNTLAIYIILLSLHVGGAILAETSLSFLGLGVPPDEPTWGGLVGVGSGKFLSLGPWLALFPGVAIALTVYGFNLLGDALRDVLDPRLRGTR